MANIQKNSPNQVLLGENVLTGEEKTLLSTYATLSF